MDAHRDAHGRALVPTASLHRVRKRRECDVCDVMGTNREMRRTIHFSFQGVENAAPHKGLGLAGGKGKGLLGGGRRGILKRACGW